MNKTVVKPITVAQTELANKIMNDVKESNLHPSILMPVIEEIYAIIQNLLKETRQKEMDEYQKMSRRQQVKQETIENETPI